MTEPESAGRALVEIDAALQATNRAIAEADRPESAVPLVGKARLMERWAQAVHAGEETERRARIFVLRAMRNAGQRIAEAQERGELHPQGRTSEIARGDVTPPRLRDLGVTPDESSDWQRLAESYTDDELVATASEMERPSLSGVLAKPHIAQASGENEWYTPPEYIAAARAAMGGIDLDPASTAVANEVVGATTFYTAEQDGLEYGWHGRVWLNPPYAQPLIARFAAKVAAAYRAGAVTAACVLVNNATETDWFQELGRACAAICFPDGRVRFWHPERVSAPLQGQAVIYLGSEPARFATAYDAFGLLVRR